MVALQRRTNEQGHHQSSYGLVLLLPIFAMSPAHFRDFW